MNVETVLAGHLSPVSPNNVSVLHPLFPRLNFGFGG